ncbi:MAG: Gfo/Idh/MocA family protein, partial [Planctomycetota bacterium]
MDQVRIGVVGVTFRGMMAKSWHKPDGRSVVVAGMDISEKALDIFKREVNADAWTTTDFDEFLARGDIDAIAVCSPDYTHAEYVIKALKAGKHVFGEKPMAIRTEDCDDMLRAWRDSGREFMVGFNMRYMNKFRVMKEIIDSGVIGEVKAVWCRHFVGYGGHFYYHDWHASSRYSTGLLLQKGSHDIDMIHWLTGKYTKRVVGMGSLDFYGGDKPDDLRCPDCPEKDECPEYQFAGEKNRSNNMDQCAFRSEVDVEDNNVIAMELEGGIKATYMQCHFTPDTDRNYTVIGTEGRLENLTSEPRVIVKTRGRSKREINLADRIYEVKPARGGHGGADPQICRDFIDMLLTGKKPVATPLAGRMSVAAGVAGTESIRNNSRMVVVPAIPDDLKDFVY